MGRPKKSATKPKPHKMTTRGLRMTEDYAAWLDSLADQERMGVSTLVDRAVAAYAKSVGFKEPPLRVP
jgi:hypothetical protein